MEPGIEVEAFHALFAPAPPETFVRLLYATGFSASAYNAHYADVAAMRWPLTNVLAHFLTHGLAERRAAPMTLNPDALVALARLPIANRAFRAALLANLAAPLATGLDQPWGPAIARHWSAARQLMGSDAHPFLIVGDSHSHQFNLASIRGAAWSLPIHVLCTGGSAMGLANPNSRSGYGQALLALFREIETLPGADALPLLMQFGQVDIEFVHHFRRVRDNRTALDLAVYRQFCEMVQERYLQFLCDVLPPHRRRRVFIVSIFPPALSDDAWRSGYVNDDIAARETAVPVHRLADGIRALRIADIRQRTDIHAYFNTVLRTACGRAGFKFVDAFTPFLGADGLLDPRYIQPERFGTDHHLDARQTHGVVAGLIWQCITAARRFP